MARLAHTLEGNKEVRSLRVVRVKLDDGKRIIGVRYPLPLISEVDSMLKILKTAVQVSFVSFLFCVLLYMYSWF